jgi:hypothetical protein
MRRSVHSSNSKQRPNLTELSAAIPKDAPALSHSCRQQQISPLPPQQIRQWHLLWLPKSDTATDKKKAPDHYNQGLFKMLWWPIAESNHGHADFQDKSLDWHQSTQLEEL